MKQVVIFDGARQVLTMIDPQKKSYTEMTKEDVEKLGAQMSDAMAKMQKQLTNMPPEQRAKMEAMMKGRMGGRRGGGKTQYRKAGTETVGKWTCDKYEGYEGGNKTSEVCTVDPKALGLTEADFAFTKEFVEFFKKIVPQMATQVFAIGTRRATGILRRPDQAQGLSRRPRGHDGDHRGDPAGLPRQRLCRAGRLSEEAVRGALNR